MSLYYVKSNKESSKELFEKRTIYNNDVQANVSQYTNLVDFNFAEKFLYGRVSRLFVPIVFTPNFLELKQVGEAGNNMFAINFVADAFNALSLQFKKCVANGQISKEAPFLSDLKIHKAYENPETLYDQYITDSYDTMAAELRARNARITNFDEFVKELMPILKASAPRFPFTRTAYIKSKICPITCSGLAIEIANLDCANDEEKINQFVESNNWEFYINTCRSYGFMVDKFIPWRIVADIGSSAMLQYAAAYGAGSTDKILNLGYSSAHRAYFDRIKYFFLNFYNKVKPTSFTEIKHCSGVITPDIITPQSYTITRLDSIYSDAYFLKLYFEIRFLEEESQFEDFEKEMLIDDCIEIYQSKGVNETLDAFERILNKTFDYRGSLGYIEEYLEANASETT